MKGSFRFLLLYDVAEAIRLDELRRTLGAPPPGRGPSFRHPMPDYARFGEPPVVEPLEPFQLESGESLDARMHYYPYGVVSLELGYSFDLDWPDLVRLSGRWVGSAEIERQASGAVRRLLDQVRTALVKPNENQLLEDYYIVQLDPMDGLSAADLVSRYGREIAQIVRGETAILSDDERNEILQGRISYYPNDVLIAGWNAAVLYDTEEGARPTIQLLEYTNVQLLEFRHYDELLTKVLEGVYDRLEQRRGFLRRWRLIAEAERLNTIRLDVRELTERLDNSIKFLSDMFSARLYRLAAAKIGVPDYRRLVDDKLETAADLYHSMVDEFQHSRAFALELMVVIILVIELVWIFRGKA